MIPEDYIKIPGLESDVPDGADDDFEIFQGLGAGSVTVTSESQDDAPSTPVPDTPISEDSDLADALWEGQNERIRGEIEYLKQIETQIKEKQRDVEGRHHELFEFGKALVGNAISEGLTGMLAPVLGPAAELVGVLADITVGWAIDKLEVLLQRGNTLIPGLIAEDEKLLELDACRENYEMRNQVITWHRDDIRLLLEQIAAMEQQLAGALNLDTDALVQALRDLQYNSQEIYWPGGIRASRQGLLTYPMGGTTA